MEVVCTSRSMRGMFVGLEAVLAMTFMEMHGESPRPPWWKGKVACSHAVPGRFPMDLLESPSHPLVKGFSE